MKPDDIVGHKTFADGSHAPLRRDEAEAMLAAAEASKAKRAQDMPDVQAALDAMARAYLRLTELGWQGAIYCPKDGTVFEAIEAGSTGIHRCHYEGEWPNGHWWAHDAGDMWPSRPILFRPLPKGDTE